MTNDKSAEEIVRVLRNTSRLLAHKAKFDAAADLIESQAAEIAELRAHLEDVTNRNDENLGMCRIWERRYAELQAQLSASQQRERAAVEDLEISAYCKTCQNQCGLNESLSRRAHGTCKDYVWRGPGKDERGEKDEQSAF